MSDVIRPGATIGGVAVERVMSLMGKAVSPALRAGLTSDEMSFLTDVGLVGRCFVLGRETFFQTPSGRSLARSRVGSRMTLSQAMSILDAVLENASSPAVASHTAPFRIRVFGSVLSGAPDPADLDLMICAPDVDMGWVCMSHYDNMFGNIPHREIFLKDARISPDEDLWCDTAVVWENGERLPEWRFEAADPEARSVFLAETDGMFGEIPLDDPSFLILPRRRSDDPAPSF